MSTLRDEAMNEVKREDLDVEIGGEYNTLRVYIYMLKAKAASMRDVQKALGFSSSTLAQHHLEKLRKYSLAVKDYDGTYRVRSSSFGILKLYVRSGRWIVPRTVFFVMIFSVLAGGFLLQISQHPYFLVAAVISIVGLVYAVYETFRSYKVLPRT